MHRNLSLFVRVAGIALALTVYGAEPVRRDVKPLVDANTSFGLALYSQLGSTEGNLTYSPFSISSALSMTYAGARGETARQMEESLRLGRVKDGAHALFGLLGASVKNAQGSNELNIANSLWPQEKYAFRSEFLGVLRQDYGASVTPLNFQSNPEMARLRINGWVSERTKERIQDLVGPGMLNESTRMMLVNAVYFKGTWATPFPQSATKTGPFYGSRNTGRAPFMHQQGSFRYGENSQAQMLALPYAGHGLEMVLLLPRERNGIPMLERNLNPTNLTAWLGSMRTEEVNVSMPKFKISSAFGLGKALKALGMRDAFDPARADFSGMDGRRWLFINAVIHKAFVEVNEKGTEAAAATGVVMWTNSVVIPKARKEFRADHPFLFLIRETQTGSILFIGRVASVS